MTAAVSSLIVIPTVFTIGAVSRGGSSKWMAFGPGNLHRPVRYSRKLRRVFYLSAQASMMRDGPNRDYYMKKRGQGHKEE